MNHIYYCEKLNKEKTTEKYDQIFGNNLNKMKYIVNRLRENMKQREKIEESQEILKCDPLQYCSNGYK